MSGAIEVLLFDLGGAALRFAVQGRWGHMVAWHPPRMAAVPIAEAVRELKTVPLNHDSVEAAEQLGICLGR